MWGGSVSIEGITTGLTELRNVQNKLHGLNPKERDMFVHVANELIENGYFTYEEGSPQVLRLTQKRRRPEFERISGYVRLYKAGIKLPLIK